MTCHQITHTFHVIQLIHLAELIRDYYLKYIRNCIESGADVIFIGEDYLITLHTGALKPLAKLFVDCEANEKSRQEYMGRSSSYLLYLILDRLINYCFPILYKIVDNIENVEDDIFAEGKRETVRELSILRRDVIAFRRIIKPQTEVFELLENEDWPVIKVDPEVYFGDIADHARNDTHAGIQGDRLRIIVSNQAHDED